MRSPVAPYVDMVTISIEGIVIDQCPVSGGHWLDHGELAKLLKADEKVETNTEKVSTETHETSRLCPRDNSPLQEVAFSGHTTLKVDVCPQCSGIWLDANELSQALTMLGRPDPEERIFSPEGAVAKHPTPSSALLRMLARLMNRRTKNRE